jgi:hypothetical protein
VLSFTFAKNSPPTIVSDVQDVHFATTDDKHATVICCLRRDEPEWKAQVPKCVDLIDEKYVTASPTRDSRVVF